MNTDKPDLLQDEYNRYPYESFPFGQSHPVHLHTLGTLFGLDPKPVQHSKILELGCASGGNIVPLAYLYPDASFVGIDLSDKEIDEGNVHVKNLGLKNIKLIQQSIVDFREPNEKYDYIICHGVYSWVNSEVREHIFRICTESLAPNGIVYISYNTYPGWHMVETIRDLMLWHSKSIDDPSLKAKSSREVITFISNGLKNNPSPYAQFFKTEIELITKQNDSYFLHDHLSTFNDPVYFYQFMDKANQYNLAYLSDVHLPVMMPDNLPESLSSEIKKINNIVVAEQYIDFIRNRRFRCTLLCHQSTVINRALKTDDIENFYIKINARPEKVDLAESDLGKNHELSFINEVCKLKVINAISQWAMYLLYLNKDHFIHYHTLVKLIQEKTHIDDIPLIKSTINNELNLLRALLAGIIEISTYPPNYTTLIEEKPFSCPFARYQIDSNQNFVTNRRHQVIHLGALEKLLLKHSDGNHDINDLIKIVLEEVQSDRLIIFDKNNQSINKNEKNIQEIVKKFCITGLDTLSHQALLVSPS